MPVSRRAFAVKGAPEAVSQEGIALFVLGMHRSGTSALARTISFLGAKLPETLLPPAADNPTGFWESAEIKALNDGIFSRLHTTWKTPLRLNFDQLRSDAEDDPRDHLVDILQRQFARSSLIVIKDPRICRLLSFWLEAVQKFGAQPRIVIIVRNPLEVASSLRARSQMEPAHSILLWLRHILEAERETRNCPRAFVAYSELLDDWRGTMTRVANQVGIIWPRPIEEAGPDIDLYLRPELKHFSSDGSYSLSSFPWAARIWQRLARIPVDEEALQPVFDEVTLEMAAADALFTPFCESAHRQLIELRQNCEQTEVASRAAMQRLKECDHSATVLQEELTTVATDRNQLRHQLAEARRQLAKAHHQIEESRRAAEKLAQAEFKHLRILFELEEALRVRTGEVEAMRASRSWRVTLPLRAIMAGLRLLLR